ncbi:hypothetical protein HDU96_002335, partial [Phlyctochytrium bullatum]
MHVRRKRCRNFLLAPVTAVKPVEVNGHIGRALLLTFVVSLGKNNRNRGKHHPRGNRDDENDVRRDQPKPNPPRGQQPKKKKASKFVLGHGRFGDIKQGIIDNQVGPLGTCDFVTRTLESGQSVLYVAATHAVLQGTADPAYFNFIREHEAAQQAACAASTVVAAPPVAAAAGERPADAVAPRQRDQAPRTHNESRHHRGTNRQPRRGGGEPQDVDDDIPPPPPPPPRDPSRGRSTTSRDSSARSRHRSPSSDRSLSPAQQAFEDCRVRLGLPPNIDDELGEDGIFKPELAPRLRGDIEKVRIVLHLEPTFTKQHQEELARTAHVLESGLVDPDTLAGFSQQLEDIVTCSRSALINRLVGIRRQLIEPAYDHVPPALRFSGDRRKLKDSTHGRL